MSSHHIVREKQEPALLVLGLDDFPDELLGQLLEWSPTVIAIADTAENLDSRGIKIDWIIADEDIALQSDVKLMHAANGNPVMIALKFLAENEYPSVNIITDELRLEDYGHFAEAIDIVIFHQQHKIYPVVSGFRKWKPKGQQVILYSLPDNLATDGLTHTGNGCFETANDGFFSLRFEAPFMFIAEEI